MESTEQTAAAIVGELFKRGPAEVGITRQETVELELVPDAPTDAAIGSSRVQRGDLVVLSGGARGITAEVAIPIAASFQPRLAVLGRSPAPGPESEWLAGLNDEAELTRALLRRSGRPLSPQELAEEARRVLVAREIRRNVDRMTAAGSSVIYRSVDLQ